MKRRTLTIALFALAAAGAAMAQADPLKSPACADALAALQEARHAEARTVPALRQEAARICLGGTGAAPGRPARVLQAPQTVPAPRIEPPNTVPIPRVTGVPPPPVAIERPPQPAQCNAAGCWVNDGTHLRHVPLPAAGCQAMPGVVYCP